MMKNAFLVILLLIFAAGATAAQQKPSGNCRLTSAPAVFGLRLNMSPEEAQAAVGGKLKIKFKTTDEKTIFQNYIEETAPPPLAAARAVYLRFFERRLYQIEIFYQENPSIKTLEDFTASLSAQWDFSASDWQREEIKSIINCQNFSIVAMKILNPKIEITDKIASAKVEAIRESKKDSKK